MKRQTEFSPRTLFWQTATVLGVIILLISPLSSVAQMLGIKNQVRIPLAVSTVEAKEIYPMFSCPCCGQPLNKEQPCCGAAIEMIDFIEQNTNRGATKEEVILSTAQEFGLERLTDESDRLALREQLLANAPEDAPQIVATETRRDLGVVSQKSGTVSTEFTIKNDGQSDLIIDKLSSSCGCTSASLVYQGEEGPRFYMAGHGHDQPDPSWQATIASGDEATVKVYYDPTIHPELTGPVTRTISVHSNDPVDFETKLTITLEQEK